MERPVRVETYSGGRADEVPRFVVDRSRRMRVERVERTSLIEGSEGRRVRRHAAVLEGGDPVELDHDLDNDIWRARYRPRPEV